MTPRVLLDFTVNPSAGGGPGGGALQTLIDYLAYILLGACVVAIVIGGGALALGALTANYRAATSASAASRAALPARW